MWFILCVICWLSNICTYTISFFLSLKFADVILVRIDNCIENMSHKLNSIDFEISIIMQCIRVITYICLCHRGIRWMVVQLRKYVMSFNLLNRIQFKDIIKTHSEVPKKLLYRGNLLLSKLIKNFFEFSSSSLAIKNE